MHQRSNISARTIDLLQEESHVYYLHRARYNALGETLQSTIPPTITGRGRG